MDEFPVIDLSDFDARINTISAKVLDACTRWGFMVLTNYGIPETKVQRMFEMVSLLKLASQVYHT